MCHETTLKFYWKFCCNTNINDQPQKSPSWLGMVSSILLKIIRINYWVKIKKNAFPMHITIIYVCVKRIKHWLALLSAIRITPAISQFYGLTAHFHIFPANAQSTSFLFWISNEIKARMNHGIDVRNKIRTNNVWTHLNSLLSFLPENTAIFKY